jgi:uncharacterized protein (TIGR02996 family)
VRPDSPARGRRVSSPFMTDEAALLQAITAHADDDTPRLVYADWLDEYLPDRRPSPAEGPSARAEFIRVQCRLAAGAFSDADYPELLERELDLATWLNTHDPDPYIPLGELHCNNQFDVGDWGEYRRGFPEIVEFVEYGEDADETVASVTAALDSGFARCPARTLRLEEAMVDEVARLARHPSFAHVRGLHLDYLDEGDEDQAVRAIALSPRSTGLRRLYFDFPVGPAGCKALALSPYLGRLESLVLDYPPVTSAAILALARARWFRNLRRLQLWLGRGDALRALADLPPMPRLESLTLRMPAPSLAAMKKFAEGRSFPRLAHLDLTDCSLSPEHVALLGGGRWRLRRLQLGRNEVRRIGCVAVATAPFARTLRILDLRGAEVTSGGVQALAGSEAFAGLRHLDLAENPIGPGGLAALAESPYLHGLRMLDLTQLNSARGPIAARDVTAFLSALDMPELRHLNLDLLPVGIRGAKVLAARRQFTHLTRLGLSGCAIGDAGAKAIVSSRSLTNLVWLDLFGNRIGRGAARLANRKMLPRLAHCRLAGGIPKSTAARLRRRPGVRV